MTNGKALHRFNTSFEAVWTARRLASFTDNKNFLPVFASAKIKVLPYQIAAARFALRSSKLKGCILCDEGSLGKTYEALLVVSQRWYEGKERILIILPSNLMEQWQRKLTEEFSLPLLAWKDYTAQRKGLCLMTYEEVVREADKVKAINWDLAVFDEADYLFKPENKSVITIKKAVGDAFKLLLTPTPITISIMDIYGLIHFIDETLLPDADSFYKRYFRKPENYGELSAWVSQFAFRTLKNQVQQYVNFTRRLPIVLNYAPNGDEKKLYALTEKYLAIADKQAYPQMDNYQLTLQFYHTLSSSTQAFANMLEAPIARAKGDEQAALQAMQNMGRQIPANAKMEVLLKALKTTFAHLKTRKETQKAIIFVDNLSTVSVLADLLKSEKYTVIKHTDENALNLFRNDKSIQVLITNDAMAKGLDIEYCPVVINYDLLYNAVEMEQRICRCHRQGQQSDVLVINLLSKENFSDVRILELINKRTLQFDGIFGMSDDIVGNFETALEEILKARRSLSDIQAGFSRNLEENKESNEQIIASAENALFTTFTKEIADNVAVSPHYIQEQAALINQDLWEVVKYYFATNHPQYVIDDTDKTITLPDNEEPPHMFYYWTGGQNRPYKGKRAYGMASDFKPATNRITLTSILVKSILQEIECYPEGDVQPEANTEPCTVCMYNVALRRNESYLKSYDILTGRIENGKVLSEEECCKLLSLPIKEYQESGHKRAYWLCTDNSPDRLDLQTEEDIRARYIKEKEKNYDADISLIKLKANRQKSVLEQNASDIRQQVKKVKDNLSTASDRLESLKIQKQLNALEKDLKRQEESLFLSQIRIDMDAAAEIDKLRETDRVTFKISPVFKIEFLQG